MTTSKDASETNVTQPLEKETRPIDWDKQPSRGYWNGRPGPGRKPGVPNIGARKALRLLQGNAQKIMQATIDKAIGGDTAAQKLCIERLLPTLMEQHRMQTGALTTDMLGEFLQLVLDSVRNTPEISKQQAIALRDNLSRALPAFAGVLAASQAGPVVDSDDAEGEESAAE